MNQTASGIGSALVERDLLRGLERLWQGQFSPDYVWKAELALRAFLISDRLFVSNLTEISNIYEEGIRRAFAHAVAVGKPLLEYEQPFGDWILDNEFVNPRELHPFRNLPEAEKASLDEFVDRQMEVKVRSILPRWITTTAQAEVFLSAWYNGVALRDCEHAARFQTDDDDETESHPLPSEYWRSFWKGDELIWSPVTSTFSRSDAAYLVGCHRAGLLVFADSPVARICEEHVFAKWPSRLFELLGEELGRLSRLISGPDIAFALPPLLSLVMSRAPEREAIPNIIVAVRDEYASARKELWALLDEMWNAKSFATQVKILRSLESAASSIVPAAFRGSVNALELAIGVASVSLSDTARTLLAHDAPIGRVSAVSFARKLSRDLRKFLENNRTILRRHLSVSERRQFGFD